MKRAAQQLSIVGSQFACEKRVGIYLCGRPAALYEVRGPSYSCRAVLCKMHAEMAQREGLKARVVT